MRLQQRRLNVSPAAGSGVRPSTVSGDLCGLQHPLVIAEVGRLWAEQRAKFGLYGFTLIRAEERVARVERASAGENES